MKSRDKRKHSFLIAAYSIYSTKNIVKVDNMTHYIKYKYRK